MGPGNEEDGEGREEKIKWGGRMGMKGMRGLGEERRGGEGRGYEEKETFSGVFGESEKFELHTNVF